MGGPWEKYAIQAAPQAPQSNNSSPWEKYAAQIPSEPSSKSNNYIAPGKNIKDTLNQFPIPTDKGALIDKAATAMESGFNEFPMFGHLPQVRAALETPFSNKPYVQLRDEAISNIKNRSEQNPNASLAGKVAGIVAPIAIAPEAEFLNAPEGAGIMSRVGHAGARGGLIGGGLGAAQNPGDTKGVVDPVQLGSRAKNSAIGAGLGLVGGGLVEAGTNLPEIGKSMSNAAEIPSYDSFKPQGKELNQLSNDPYKFEEQMKSMGRTGIDKKITGGFPKSPQKMAEATHDALKETGESFGNFINQIDEALKKKTASLKPGEAPPPRIGTDLEKAGNKVKEEMILGRNVEGGKPRTVISTATKAKNDNVAAFIDDYTKQAKFVDPSEAQLLKKEVDDLASWHKRPDQLTHQEEIARKFSTSLKQEIENSADEAVKYLESTKQLPEGFSVEEFKKLKKDYGNLSSMKKSAMKVAKRNVANRASSMSDTQMAQMGGIGGAIINPSLAIPAAAAGNITNKIARKYGSQIKTGLLNQVGGLLQKAPSIGTPNGLIAPYILNQTLNRTNPNE